MDQSRGKGSPRARDLWNTPRKNQRGDVAENRPPSVPLSSNNIMVPTVWDCNHIGPYFAMMNLSEMKSVESPNHFIGQPAPPPVVYSPPTPFTDIANYNYFQNFSPMLQQLPRQRKSSLLPSDSESSQRTWSDESYTHKFGDFRRPFSSADYRSSNRRDNLRYNSQSTRYSRSDSNNNYTSSLLPHWALDSHGGLRSNLSLPKIVDSGELVKFAMDKTGCQFLQDLMRKPLTNPIKDAIFQQILGHAEVFLKLSSNIFGNFFIQQVIELSSNTNDSGYNERQEKIKRYIGSRMAELCLDKSACRVVQFALDSLDLPLSICLVQRLPRDSRLISICLDQNANHVIQKIVSVIPLQKWEFIVDFIIQPQHLRQICADKYGCRVVQTIIEKLNVDSSNKDLTNLREMALQRLMTAIISRCSELASNEYANYIIQHIIASDDMAMYRETIIEKCLMRNLLSMSQEKYASHVVEKAFLHAPLGLLAEMMDEIFDGYVPHPDTGKDALDIMMYHQFGNYVVQCMLDICRLAVDGKKNTIEGGFDYMSLFYEWREKLRTRVMREKSRLSRFSSGKKMIDSFTHIMDASYAQADYDVFTTTSEDESKSDNESVFLERRQYIPKNIYSNQFG
ncbi:unnamed protein product [Caenorhabditis bovis]|uniref:PUM-HD domain-containing protein n=1 Tax=Caenorhabditis bovis TaxID=2654633 RepID=A0A8S1EGJ4_9PELO|nr:unnamed protein product [Caenorhabditis bovis]